MENKYFKSESVEVMRSEIRPAAYNPRKISAEARKQLKKSIKLYGVVGGIVVNAQTGNTVVGGHQKISVLDELNKYPDNDYSLRVELIDVDEKTEKQLNVTLNNPNVGGEWDYDLLREIIPEIDYKDSGLTEEDLSLIGIDFMFETEEEASINDEIEDLMAPVTRQKEAEKVAKKEEREAKKEMTREEQIAHNKEVKKEVAEKAEEKAKDMEAYVMISFDTFQNKAMFMKRMGYSEWDKFIKGEEFQDKVERIE